MTKNASEKQDQWKSEDEKIDALVTYIRSLGLEKLATDISEEKFMRRILDARISYDYHVLQSEIWKDRSEKALDWAVSVQAALFDKASTYNNVVLTLGYAGFFAIWSMVSAHLEKTENAFIGASLGLSLLLFICWTLLNSFLFTLNIRHYALIAGTEFDTYEDELEAHKKAEDKVNRAVLRLQRFWPLVFALTVITGLAPGLVLLVELLYQIGGVDLGIVEKVVG